MAMAWRQELIDGVLKLELDQPGTEVNVLDSANLAELRDLLDSVAKRPEIMAILLTSAKKRIFIAGADIKEIDSIRTREEAFEKAELGKAVFQKLEDFPRPDHLPEAPF